MVWSTATVLREKYALPRSLQIRRFSSEDAASDQARTEFVVALRELTCTVIDLDPLLAVPGHDGDARAALAIVPAV